MKPRCLLFAARRDVGSGVMITMVGAVLGQTDLAAALDAAKTAVETGYSGYGVVPASPSFSVASLMLMPAVTEMSR